MLNVYKIFHALLVEDKDLKERKDLLLELERREHNTIEQLEVNRSRAKQIKSKLS